MEMYESDVDGIRWFIPVATPPTATVTAAGDSHEAGGAHHRADEG